MEYDFTVYWAAERLAARSLLARDNWSGYVYANLQVSARIKNWRLGR